MVITLREGGETSLILALLFSSLKAARHVAYRAAAWTGFALALGLSIIAGVFLHDLGELGPLFGGSLAWIGAGFIASLAIQLHMNAVDYRAQLKQLRDSATVDHVSWTTALGIGSFAFVSVIREGLETAVFLANGTGPRSDGSWLGAGVGLALAAALGVSVYLGFRKLNIRAFMRTTEILLFALVISLFLSGLHEFSEAGVLSVPRPLDLFHLTWIQGGLFLQVLLCAGPFLYLAFAGGPPIHYARGAGIAILLAVIPMSLGAGARAWEHARLAPSDRDAALGVERAAETRARAMVSALETLRERSQRGDIAGARTAWVEARGRFVQIEPLLARNDGEFTEELNGEPGEGAGFHGAEAELFLERAPWGSNPARRAALVADLGDLLTRGRVAAGKIDAMTLDPAVLRDAWTKHAWVLRGRIDGQECGASQTSISEWHATLDAMDGDLGGNGRYTEPVRAVLAPAFAEAARGPRFGEHREETRVAPDRLHTQPPLTGPDRVWDSVDRQRLRRALDETLARIERDASVVARHKGR
jgi:high-affinity iron transporter